MISDWKHAHPAVECIIVFDGDRHFSSAAPDRIMGINCIFSKKTHGGDDEIIKLIRIYRGDKTRITVVSDDNYVGNNSRAYGVRAQPADFLDETRSSTEPLLKKPSGSDKDLDCRSASKITDELKSIFGIKS